MGSGREEPEPESISTEEASNLTKQRVAAAKQYIENHYKEQMRNLQERRERYGIPYPLFIYFGFRLTTIMIGNIKWMILWPCEICVSFPYDKVLKI